MPGNRRLDREEWFHAGHPNDTSGRIQQLEVNEEAADFHGACPLRSAECVKNSSVFPRLCCPRQRVFLNPACRVYRDHLSIQCRKQSLVLTIDQNIQNGRCVFLTTIRSNTRRTNHCHTASATRLEKPSFPWIIAIIVRR